LSLVPVIQRLSSAVVACVGDVMLDSFVYGSVSRVSPEAPIPVLHIERRQSMLGGAGNAVRNLSALGCAVRFFSATGDDEEAAVIARLLAALPGNQAHLECEPGRQTPVKTRFVARGQQLLRSDSETSTAINAATAGRLLGAFTAALPDCRIVLLSDYAKGVLSGHGVNGHGVNGHGVERFIDAARRAGKPVVVDPKGRDFARYRGATLIKPNLLELGEATGLDVSSDAGQEAAARRLLQDTGAEYILVTRGAQGMMLTSADAPVLRFPAMAREVYDVSGAGDTVAAALAAALGSGASITNAVEVANIAAGLVVGKAGTAVVDRTEIIHEVQHQSAIRASDKVMRMEEAISLARSWAHAGLKVGFTEGSFDLLHPGHLKLLETARAHCDRLLVGLHGDECIERRRGPARPVQNQTARALVLASLNCVDAVVMLDAEASTDLIGSLRPDVLVNGTAGVVESWGGVLLVVENLPGWSTTETIVRLRS
jgi:D-beta-D-heptose 7-phosphate kinase / D-beta-D-heptose 1-phosphate adenosyltransferase